MSSDSNCCTVFPTIGDSIKIKYSGDKEETTVYFKCWKQCDKKAEKQYVENVSIDGKDNELVFNVCEAHMKKEKKKES